jgi:16S rRNA (guanine527-N7)-methyltransferase
MTAPSPALVAQAQGLGVSRESWLRIERFVSLLLTWQQRVNLISSASIPHVWERHVLDSLQLLPLFAAHAKGAADLGSGSGFPALPLAIATGIPFHLYESNQKKAAFLREALRVTGAKGEIHVQRLEGSNKAGAYPKVDIVTARALAPLSELLALAEPFLAQGATGLFLKGQDVDEELTQAAKSWNISATKHASLTDSLGVVLAVQEMSRV